MASWYMGVLFFQKLFGDPQHGGCRFGIPLEPKPTGIKNGKMPLVLIMFFFASPGVVRLGNPPLSCSRDFITTGCESCRGLCPLHEARLAFVRLEAERLGMFLPIAYNLSCHVVLAFSCLQLMCLFCSV